MLAQKKNRLDLLLQLVKTNFKMRYQNSFLGILWVLAKPYSTFFVLYFLWSKIGRTGENYQLYLLLGIIFYTYFQELIVYGQNSLLDRAHIILKVNFPRQIAIMSSLINALINLAINVVFIIAIILFSGVGVTFGGVLYFLFIALMVFVFCLGLSFFFSILTIRLRDLTSILDLGLFLLYWASPVFYRLDASLLGSSVTQLIAMSPISIVLGQVRAAFGIDGQINFGLMVLYFFISIVIAIVGWYYFRHNVKYVAEHF